MKNEFATIVELLAHLRLPVGDGKDREGFCTIGRISDDLAARVLAATGHDVTDFALILDRSGVLHTIKQHGLPNAASEVAQGQVPIEAPDFETLAEWLPTPQAVLPGLTRTGQNPLQCVEFQFALPTGNVSAVLDIRFGRRRLALVTMYKKRPTA